RPFGAMLDQAARTSTLPIVTEGTHEEVRADLAYWRVEAVVLADAVHGAKWAVDEEALRRTLTMLLGEPERVEDVWLWRIRRE
ncbi:DUF2079 domain-containing protein, partial [Micromonospora sp. NPDC051296]